jgi:hypothetical protein
LNLLQTVDSGSGEYNLARALFADGTLYSCGFWGSLDGELFVAWTCDEAVIELPQVYPRSKPDPNDLIVLAASAGRAREAIGWSKSRFVLPREWKGTLNGDAMAVRIVEALSEDERRVYFAAVDKIPEGSHDNVADAVGIGLWKLGRLGRQNLTRARANATKGKRRRT